MGHDHHVSGDTSSLRTAFFLNAFFSILEIIGGFYTNSVSILADAVHDLGDSLSLGLSWFLERKSLQKGDKTFTFGYQRFSLLGALINGAVLITGSIFIIIETLPRLIEPTTPNATGMFFFAILGVIVNGAAVFSIGKGSNLNQKMVRWHLLEDVLGWVAVLIVSVILMFWDIPILDPILSLLILIYVLYNVFRNLNETFKVLLQGVPKGMDISTMEEDILALDHIVSLHHAHVWSLDGSKNVMSIHIVISEVTSVLDIITVKRQIKSILKEKGVIHATIELEFEDEECYMDTD